MLRVETGWRRELEVVICICVGFDWRFGLSLDFNAMLRSFPKDRCLWHGTGV